MSKLFQDKKWSEALKEATQRFFETHAIIYPKTEKALGNLIQLIELAIEEGRQEVLDDPNSFDLVSKDEVHQHEPRERDEDG